MLHNSKRVATTNGTFNKLPSYFAIFRNVMSRGGQKVNLYLENMFDILATLEKH